MLLFDLAREGVSVAEDEVYLYSAERVRFVLEKERRGEGRYGRGKKVVVERRGRAARGERWALKDRGIPST